MNDIIGKTVAATEVQAWAGKDTYKDDVTWERTVVTFTDGSTITLDSFDTEIYDEYRAVFDDDGRPQRYVEETDACKRCGHGIGYDPVEGWVAPDAGFDREGGDGIWRDTCPDNHESPDAPHEPSVAPDAYRHTHVSTTDGSPAMLVQQDDDQITLMNEDGFEWTDPASDWRPIEPDSGLEDDLRLIRKHDGA